MKRLTSAFLAIVLCLSLTACGENNKSTSQTDKKTKQVAKQTDVKKNSADNSTPTLESLQEMDASLPNSNETSHRTIEQTDTAKESEEIQKTLNEVTNNISDNIFYGDWVVGSQIIVDKESFDKNTAKNKLKGKKVSYSPTMAKFDKDVCKNPSYKEIQLANFDFIAKGGPDPKLLGISSPMVVCMYVFTSSDNKTAWKSSGNRFIVVDKDNLILMDKEGYFVLKRAK